MSDRIQVGDDGIPRKYIDELGDNSYFAEVVAVAGGGGGGGGGAVTIANGADIAEGTVGDVGVTGDTSGTVSAKLRGLNITTGSQSDAAASSDAGTFSIVAFWKRLLGKFTTQFPAALTSSGNFKVSIAENTATGTSANQVQGTAADGAAATGNPLQTGGVDGSGNAQAFLTATTGALRIDPVGTTTQPVSVASGADVVEGATADAAIVTDTTGSVNGKLRGLVKWAFERMPASLGQKLIATSLPVVLPSDAIGTNALQFQGNLAINDPLPVDVRVVVVGGGNTFGETQPLSLDSSNYLLVSAPNGVQGPQPAGDPVSANPFAIGISTSGDLAYWGGGGAPTGAAGYVIPLPSTSPSGIAIGEVSGITLLSLLARTASAVSNLQNNAQWRGLLLFVNVTSAGAGIITPKLEAISGITGSGVAFPFWTAATPLATNGLRAYLFYPGASGGAYTEILPCGLGTYQWRLTITHSNANSITYGADAVLLP